MWARVRAADKVRSVTGDLLITVAEALDHVRSATPGPLPAEACLLAEAADRVLAESLAAPTPMPAFTSSAFDGYAVRAADLAGGLESLEVLGESRAGTPWEGAPVESGQAVRIMTGAVMPAGADAVVGVEHAEEGDGTVALSQAPPVGQHVRVKGEIRQAGDDVVAADARMSPGRIALAATLGAGELQVRQRPKASVIVTGDELREPGEAAAEGALFDSNGPMLSALLVAEGCEPPRAQRCADTPEALAAAVPAALETADLLVLSGGVSKGRYDFVAGALEAAGVSCVFHGVAVKPGKPVWFGVRETGTGPVPVFGLPGNPFSVFATFLLFVRPALARLQGLPEPAPVWGTLAQGRIRGKGRETWIPCRATVTAEGALLEPLASRGSHDLTALEHANALAGVPEGGEAQAGDRITYLPFGWGGS